MIGDLVPAATALRGKLRLYCNAEALARRTKMRAALMRPLGFAPLPTDRCTDRPLHRPVHPLNPVRS